MPEKSIAFAHSIVTHRLKIKHEHSSSNDANEHELFLKIINDSHLFVSFDDKDNDETLNTLVRMGLCPIVIPIYIVTVRETTHGGRASSRAA